MLVCGYHYNAQKYQDIFQENELLWQKVKQERDFVVVKEEDGILNQLIHSQILHTENKMMDAKRMLLCDCPI